MVLIHVIKITMIMITLDGELSQPGYDEQNSDTTYILSKTGEEKIK